MAYNRLFGSQQPFLKVTVGEVGAHHAFHVIKSLPALCGIAEVIDEPLGVGVALFQQLRHHLGSGLGQLLELVSADDGYRSFQSSVSG